MATIKDDESFLNFRSMLDQGHYQNLTPMLCVETSNNKFRCFSHGEYWIKSITISPIDGRRSIEYTKIKTEALAITGRILAGRILTYGCWIPDAKERVRTTDRCISV